MEIDTVALLRERLPEMPLVVMAREPDPAGHTLELQDYIMDGTSVLPLFSSQEALTESLRGASLGRPVYAISRALLVSLLHGGEVFLLDPQLPAQLRFTAAQLREAFPDLLP